MRNLRTLDEYRRPLHGYMADEACGQFIIPNKTGMYCVIAANGDIPESEGWDHVSVHCRDLTALTLEEQEKGILQKYILRTPSWDEMCHIKELFFNEDECVVQFHPAKKDYVNVHPHVLHLWRDAKGHRMPPTICV